MDDDITTALCSIIQLFINKQKKMEDELKLLLISCEIEESNLRYYESIVEFLSLHGVLLSLNLISRINYL